MCFPHPRRSRRLLLPGSGIAPRCRRPLYARVGPRWPLWMRRHGGKSRRTSSPWPQSWIDAGKKRTGKREEDYRRARHGLYLACMERGNRAGSCARRHGVSFSLAVATRRRKAHSVGLGRVGRSALRCRCLAGCSERREAAHWPVRAHELIWIYSKQFDSNSNVSLQHTRSKFYINLSKMNLRHR
jgi:hypothetical protein